MKLKWTLRSPTPKPRLGCPKRASSSKDLLKMKRASVGGRDLLACRGFVVTQGTPNATAKDLADLARAFPRGGWSLSFAKSRSVADSDPPVAAMDQSSQL